MKMLQFLIVQVSNLFWAIPLEDIAKIDSVKTYLNFFKLSSLLGFDDDEITEKSRFLYIQNINDPILVQSVIGIEVVESHDILPVPQDITYLPEKGLIGVLNINPARSVICKRNIIAIDPKTIIKTK